MRWFLPLVTGFLVTLVVASLISYRKVIASYIPAQPVAMDDIALTQENEKANRLLSELNSLRGLALQRREQCKPLPTAPLEKPAPLAMQPGNEMEMPSNLKPLDVKFLEGCWNSDAGLTNSKTGDPVIVEYCFDASGNGRRTVNEPDDKCTGAAKATIHENGDLVIDDQGNATCGRHRGGYSPYSTVCQRDEDGKAGCFLQNKETTQNKLKSKFTRAR